MTIAVAQEPDMTTRFAICVALLLCMAVGVAKAQDRPHANISPGKPLIIDTDMGTDDWLAISYIAQNPKIDLLGVTIVGNGLASCDYAGRNAQHLLSMSLRNANKPIGCGSSWPMDGYASYPSIWRETGADMMGEMAKSAVPSQRFPDGPTLLAQLLRSSQVPVNILAIGSMTNIATVITVEPELRSKIQRIYSMGGAVRTGGNLRVHGFTDHHQNTKAEWNYYIDPVAAKIVFDSGVPITLVPLDATNKVPLTSGFIERMNRSSQQPLEAFTHRIFNNIVKSTTNGEYFHWDPLTAAVAANPDLCDEVSVIKLDVVTDNGKDKGLPNGQPAEFFPLLNVNGKKRTPLNEHAAGATVMADHGKPIQVCLHVDASRFENNFIDTLRFPNQ